VAVDWHRNAVQRITLGVGISLILRLVVGINDAVMFSSLRSPGVKPIEVLGVHGDIRLVGFVGGILAALLIATGFTRFAAVDRAVRAPALLTALAFLAAAAIATTLILFFQSMGAGEIGSLKATVRWWSLSAVTIGALGWIAAISATTAAARVAKVDLLGMQRVAVVLALAAWALPASRHVFRYDLPMTPTVWGLLVMLVSSASMAMVLVLVRRYGRDYRPAS